MTKFTEFDYGITGLCSRFHQDWTNDGTAQDVLHNYIWEGQNGRAVEILRRDAELVTENLPDQHVKTLWVSCIDSVFKFSATDSSGTEWMRMIEKACSEWMEGKPLPELSRADCDLGFAHLPDALGVIDTVSAYGVSDEVKGSLAYCAQTCSPDLALRFIFRVLSVSNATIDPNFYQRMSALGASLGFGEFLISDIEFLVE